MASSVASAASLLSLVSLLASSASAAVISQSQSPSAGSSVRLSASLPSVPLSVLPSSLAKSNAVSAASIPSSLRPASSAISSARSALSSSRPASSAASIPSSRPPVSASRPTSAISHAQSSTNPLSASALSYTISSIASPLASPATQSAPSSWFSCPKDSTSFCLGTPNLTPILVLCENSQASRPIDCRATSGANARCYDDNPTALGQARCAAAPADAPALVVPTSFNGTTLMYGTNGTSAPAGVAADPVFANADPTNTDNPSYPTGTGSPTYYYASGSGVPSGMPSSDNSTSTTLGSTWAPQPTQSSINGIQGSPSGFTTNGGSNSAASASRAVGWTGGFVVGGVVLFVAML